MTFDRRIRAALAALLLLVAVSLPSYAVVDRAVCSGSDPGGASCDVSQLKGAINEEVNAVDNRSPMRLSSVSGTDTVTASITPTLTSYVDGQRFSGKPVNTNTGAVTLNINGIGAKPLVDETGSALQAGEFVSGTAYQIEYFGGGDDHFRIMNGLAVTTASSITFPATQVPSAGANTLDDYEEGTFVPSLTFDNAAVGMTYTTQEGSYTKVGRQVCVSINIVLSAKGSSTGTARITGLPFAANASNATAGAIYATGMSSLVDGTLFRYTGAFSTISLYTGSATGNVGMTHANFNNTSAVNTSFCYFV